MRRSIPAWAGEPSGIRPTSDTAEVYPRVGGGTIRGACFSSHRKGLSPRGRGNHPKDVENPYHKRSIPAWAGEPQNSHESLYP